ncbi:hypothetical protein, partial [Streptomyces rhizosphaericus]|uniref:hypothetical protein n=1 Tax=Streptomyces rhizosphaericus TaxID=114699 RepID=UPI0031D0EE29
MASSPDTIRTLPGGSLDEVVATISRWSLVTVAMPVPCSVAVKPRCTSLGAGRAPRGLELEGRVGHPP